MDGAASLIEDIVTGDGLPTGTSGVDYGTVTPSPTPQGTTITHGLDAILCGILWTESQHNANTDATFTLFSMTIKRRTINQQRKLETQYANRAARESRQSRPRLVNSYF